LPEYPHLVGFRFLRSVGNEIVIFAEYVKGGSLKDWIDEKDLYQGGHKEALRRILDIAIQFAWRLDVAHKKGVVHQDVKPANVLISSDETAKVKGVQVTDYGLPRARATAGIITSEVSNGGALVSHAGGYTPEFSLPEQSLMGKLSLKTDIWSWGVSVLEMFTGEACHHPPNYRMPSIIGAFESCTKIRRNLFMSHPTVKTILFLISMIAAHLCIS